MKVYKDKTECYGCSACDNICPVNAIYMEADDEGFQYPKIDMKLCINCNKCRKVCPYNNNFTNMEKEDFKQLFYAAKNKDKQVVKDSSSGGIFSALSDYILSKNGKVYGASFDKNFKVIHIVTICKEDRDRLRGSKYVQSDIQDIYSLIFDDLVNKRYVLFSGTPCQNAGLINYLEMKKIKRELLFTCDFICHGVSSPLIWDNYVSFLQDKYRDKLVEFSFRSKKNGWRKFDIEAILKNNKIDDRFNKKYSYLNLYNSRLITRKSCFNCQYTSYDRMTDITIADFWNIGHVIPEFNDDHGISLVIVNTSKGYNWFSEISNSIDYRVTNKKDSWQPHLEYPVKMPKNRDKFWLQFYSNGFSKTINKYGAGTLSANIIKKLTPIIKAVGLYSLAGKMYNKILGKS